LRLRKGVWQVLFSSNSFMLALQEVQSSRKTAKVATSPPVHTPDASASSEIPADWIRWRADGQAGWSGLRCTLDHVWHISQNILPRRNLSRPVV